MSELHSWARALGGYVTGGGILCPGPGHTAKDRSLSVKIGRDGEPICYSHSGDDPILCKDFVREKVGLKPFKPNGHAAASSTKQHFDYCGSDGALLYQVEREDLPGGGKKIRQRRPDGASPGWIWDLKGVESVPYRLTELLEAIANGRTVVIVEGEAKVDLLLSWNIPATCNSGGAGKWRAQHAAYLAKADVVILPDNDQPGRDHAGAVAASLKEAGASVRVLDLPGLGPKGDVIDWAAAGGTVEQLHALIERDARPWAPGGKPEGANRGQGWSAIISPKNSEDFLALEFAKKHGEDSKYVAPWGKWLEWTGDRWRQENTLKVFELARKICRAAANACQKSTEAKNLAKSKTVAAVEHLSRLDRRMAATKDQWDLDEFFFNPRNADDNRS
jgi:putative DNA primase/helicase